MSVAEKFHPKIISDEVFPSSFIDIKGVKEKASTPKHFELSMEDDQVQYIEEEDWESSNGVRLRPIRLKGRVSSSNNIDNINHGKRKITKQKKEVENFNIEEYLEKKIDKRINTILNDK